MILVYEETFMLCLHFVPWYGYLWKC